MGGEESVGGGVILVKQEMKLDNEEMTKGFGANLKEEEEERVT